MCFCKQSLVSGIVTNHTAQSSGHEDCYKYFYFQRKIIDYNSPTEHITQIELIRNSRKS